MPPRIRKVDVQGFRSFGCSRQTFELSDTVNAFWGGNSQGKTSLAEAFEFLLTGQIVRREMTASSKDEFSEALRNAHLPNDIPVQVSALVLCDDGSERRLTRTLLQDYGRAAAGCTSRLEIDGAAAAEGEITTRLGIKLSQPPLKAPVLAQHTLAYLFTASPSDRAAYFRAVLDTQDLEDFRAAVAALAADLATPALPGLASLSAIEQIEQDVPAVSEIRSAGSLQDLQNKLSKAVNELLSVLSLPTVGDVIERCERLNAELEVKQSRTFPLALLSRKAEALWMDFPADARETIDIFEAERVRVDLDARRLVDLFEAALALPNLASAEGSVDCPLCETKGSLTEERRAAMRLELQKAEAYQRAEKNLLQ